MWVWLLSIVFLFEGCSDESASRVRQTRNRMFAEHMHKRSEPVEELLSADPSGEVKLLMESILPKYWACEDNSKLEVLEKSSYLRNNRGPTQADYYESSGDESYDFIILNHTFCRPDKNICDMIELYVAFCFEAAKLELCRWDFSRFLPSFREWSQVRDLYHLALPQDHERMPNSSFIDKYLQRHVPLKSIVGMKIRSERHTTNPHTGRVSFAGNRIVNINASSCCQDFLRVLSRKKIHDPASLTYWTLG